MVARSFRSAPAQNMLGVLLHRITARTLGSKRIFSSSLLNCATADDTEIS